jgi:hypothetical protein
VIYTWYWYLIVITDSDIYLIVNLTFTVSVLSTMKRKYKHWLSTILPLSTKLVNDCCLTPTQQFFQLYHGENKLIFNEIKSRSDLYQTNHLSPKTLWILKRWRTTTYDVGNPVSVLRQAYKCGPVKSVNGTPIHLLLLLLPNTSWRLCQRVHMIIEQVKTIYMFHNLVLNRGDSSFECFNRATRNYGLDLQEQYI